MWVFGRKGHSDTYHILLVPRGKQGPPPPFFSSTVLTYAVAKSYLADLNGVTCISPLSTKHVASRVRLTRYLPYTIWSHFSQSSRSRRPLCCRLHRNDAKWTKVSIVGWQLSEKCTDCEAPFPSNVWASYGGSPQLTTNVCEAFHSHYRNTFTVLTPMSFFFIWVKRVSDYNLCKMTKF